MPQNTFLSTGIVDGQPVEAFQVSQSVDAFTAQADYRITHTGSYTLSGSLLMTGSLVNEYTGQFSSLGIGVTAPTAPTMLRIKDTSGAGDPIALLEGETGTDSARIRFSNTDVTYDVGAYGSSGDSFMLVQDQNNTPKFPIISEKDVASYVLYLSDTKVGIDLGASAGTILAPLPKGSLQVSGSVSGSLLIAQTITASADGPDANIHGTASHAINVVTAETGSYVKFSNVDTFYSASGQANFENNIATIQSSSAHSFRFGKVDAAIVDFQNATLVSGSSGGDSYFGGVDENCYVKVGGSGNFIKLNSGGGEVYIENDAIVNSDLRVSGSATPSLIVGPNTGAPGSNNPSASLFHDSLEFYKANAVYIGNYNNSSLAETRIVGGGIQTSGFSVSSSGDLELKLNNTALSAQFNINLGGRNSGNSTTPIQAFSTGSYMLVGDMKRSSGGPNKIYYQVSQSQITQAAGAPDNDKALWIGDNSFLGNVFDDRMVILKTQLCAANVSTTGEGAYFEQTTAFRANGGTYTKIGSTVTHANIESTSVADVITTISASGGNIYVKGSNSQNASVMWSGFIEVLTFANAFPS